MHVLYFVAAFAFLALASPAFAAPINLLEKRAFYDTDVKGCLNRGRWNIRNDCDRYVMLQTFPKIMKRKKEY
ncbi:hypothetical protein BGW36DRAFT_53055 [Talaromyces proteolyticus]|uniref:Uncharacterized protein n=1 Tax=Talaromyces proteolyticus TaxID=1131652 RepID=A0AAD4PWE8_9EURO|nr:uncharacterized protein BGW36DRAFT_53055 [Talaromyces proteolyticus]KAH8691449.1 hypothetical protein BGW36DRAFT_53055 [Talaromyces proteolyticus]